MKSVPTNYLTDRPERYPLKPDSIEFVAIKAFLAKFMNAKEGAQGQNNSKTSKPEQIGLAGGHASQKRCSAGACFLRIIANQAGHKAFR